MKILLKKWVHRGRVFRLITANTVRQLLVGRQDIAAIRVPNLLLAPVIHIDPNKILYAASVAIKPAKGNALFLSGDWDLERQPLHEIEVSNPKYVSCRQLLDGDVSLEETREYSLIMAAIRDSGSYRGCQNTADALRHIQARQDFYMAMQCDGYKSQAMLGGSRYQGEIECALDRDGNLIKINAGNHRFAAARYLGLTSIPVHLAVIHAEHLQRLPGGGLSALRHLIADIEARYA
jgi:hypothetical protein